jgi:hypothetical protein
MAHLRHYSPQISRFLVSVLYHEAKKRRIPMTKLTDSLLAQSLHGSTSWAKAESSFSEESSLGQPIKH